MLFGQYIILCFIIDDHCKAIDPDQMVYLSAFCQNQNEAILTSKLSFINLLL